MQYTAAACCTLHKSTNARQKQQRQRNNANRKQHCQNNKTRIKRNWSARSICTQIRRCDMHTINGKFVQRSEYEKEMRTKCTHSALHQTTFSFTLISKSSTCYMLCIYIFICAYVCIFLIFIHNHWPLSLSMLAAMKIFSFAPSRTEIRHKVSGLSAQGCQNLSSLCYIVVCKMQIRDMPTHSIWSCRCRRCYFSDGISNHCQIQWIFR